VASGWWLPVRRRLFPPEAHRPSAVRRAALVVLLVVTVPVGACTAEPERRSAPGATAAASNRSTEDLPGSTPVGTRLRFGEKAVITVGVGDTRARIGVVVTGVEQGSPQDAAQLATMVADRSATDPVYFIHAVLINDDGMSTGGSYSGPTLYGDLADGGDAGGFQLLGATVALPHCVSVSHQPLEWNVAGARNEICRIIFARPQAVRLPVRTGSISWS
jgi:hypothetical protein